MLNNQNTECTQFRVLDRSKGVSDCGDNYTHIIIIVILCPYFGGGKNTWEHADCQFQV